MSKGRGQKIAIKFTQELVGDVTGLTPAPLGYRAGDVDLARGKSVTVGNAGYGSGSNAIDGNDTTFWGTYSTMPWWIMIDMAEVKKTAGFYILQSDSSYRGRAFSIQGSNDNAVWNTISTGELENIAEQTIQYNSSDYRYIKLNVTSYWNGSRMYVHTLKILEAVPVGNELAFSVTGKQYLYTGGTLIDGDYQVDKVERYPIPKLYDDNFQDGTANGVEVGENGLVLAKAGGK